MEALFVRRKAKELDDLNPEGHIAERNELEQALPIGLAAAMLKLRRAADMTKVTILPVPTHRGGKSYFAVSGTTQSFGHTAGEALDALTAQLKEEETGTMVIVQSMQPDAFFDAAEQRRLGELMERWRTARDGNHDFPANEQKELERLVEAELRASAARTAATIDELP